MVRIRIRRVVRYDDGCFCVVALLLVSSLSSVLLFQSFGEVQEEGKEAKRSQNNQADPGRLDERFQSNSIKNATQRYGTTQSHKSIQIMMEPSLTTLIGDEIQVNSDKWSSFVDGKNGFLYGIPSNARRVVKFNPVDKSLTEIVPDLGEGEMK